MLIFQPAGFEQHFISTRFGQVAYYSTGRSLWRDRPSNREDATRSQLTSAKPSQVAVLFFHSFGGGASAYEWSKVYPVFSGLCTVIAPDLLGWGASAKPRRRYTTQDYVATLEDFIKQVSNDPVVAVASSFTAGLVARLAVEQPDLFESLFLVCPAGFRDFGSEAGRRLPEPLINTPFLDRAIYALGATNELAVRNFLENFLFAKGDRLSAETVAAYLAAAQQPNAEYAALSFLRGDLYFDLAPYWAHLQVPTALVWGEKAQFTPAATGRRLANLNPKAVQRFQVVSDTGVLPHLEQPAAVAALLLDWLNRD